MLDDQIVGGLLLYLIEIVHFIFSSDNALHITNSVLKQEWIEVFQLVSIAHVYW